MDNETIAGEALEPVVETIEPVPQPVVEPFIEPEQTYTYQPTDDAGRPLGGAQVIKYRTQTELIDRMKDQSVLLIRKLRTETRKNRLGISEPEEIGADAQRYEQPIEFTKRELTPDERVQLSRDLLDPEKFDQASTAFFESTVGVRPDALRQTLTMLQEDNLKFKAKAESDAFVAANPEYVKCAENFQSITNWMLRYKLAPTRENFQQAYDKLRAAGIIIESEIPNAGPPAPPQPAPETPETAQDAPEGTEVGETIETIPEPPVARPVPAKVPARIPVSLNNTNSGNSGPAKPVIGDDIMFELIRRDNKGNPTGEKKVFRGMAAVDAMPSDIYKHRILHEPGFQKKVEKLETDAKARRQGQGPGPR